MTTSYNDTLLLVLPVALVRTSAGLAYESQACHGIMQWAKHFKRVIAACPTLIDPSPEQLQSSTWEPVETAVDLTRISQMAVDSTYNELSFDRINAGVFRL
jgi:hypothetical protein